MANTHKGTGNLRSLELGEQTSWLMSYYGF